MSERGESLDPMKMLNVASWRKLRAWCRHLYRGLRAANCRLPNTRVQRTRSSPSALRSPLTRHPLGSREAREQHSEIGLVPLDFGAGEMILVS